MIVNDEQRRTMEFIATVNLGGYRPTGREINQWRLHPNPRPQRRGKLLEPEVPAEPDRRVLRKGRQGLAAQLDAILNPPALGDTVSLRNQGLASALQSLHGSRRDLASIITGSSQFGLLGTSRYETVPGRPGKPAVYAPDRPAEKFLAHLRRLGWISRDGQRRYGLTSLGRALLAAVEYEESERQESSVVVLAPQDQKLGYGQVVGRISTCGDALVADPYLGTQELRDLLEHTDASRFLIGPNLRRDRVTELAVLIQLSPFTERGKTRSLRRASFHDRYVLGEQQVFTLTASLNGVSKMQMALLMEMTDVAADAIRTHVEELWTQAEPIAVGPSQQDVAMAQAADSDSGPVVELIREHEGRFLHDGCEVRHKSPSTAENCMNRS